MYSALTPLAALSPCESITVAVNCNGPGKSYTFFFSEISPVSGFTLSHCLAAASIE